MTFRSKLDGTAIMPGEGCVTARFHQVAPTRLRLEVATTDKVHCKKRSFVTRPWHYSKSHPSCLAFSLENSTRPAMNYPSTWRRQHQDISFNLASASFLVSSGTFGLLIAALRPPALQQSKTRQQIHLLAQRRMQKGSWFLHVVRVLALVRSGLDVAAVELVVQNITRVLLGFLRGVGVVEVSLVAADDVAWVGHFGMSWWVVDRNWCGSLDWRNLWWRVFELMS
jgi:hypothetical protein